MDEKPGDLRFLDGRLEIVRDDARYLVRELAEKLNMYGRSDPDMAHYVSIERLTTAYLVAIGALKR